MALVLFAMPFTPLISVAQSCMKIVDVVFDTEFTAHTIFYGGPELTERELKERKDIRDK